MPADHEYAAFISYAHKDKDWAAWLHRKLEHYRVPRRAESEHAGQRPLRPVFRDRDELTASSALGDALMSALTGSKHLIIICSPNSAKSHWCNEEIRAFRRIHGVGYVLALIVEGEPGSGGNDECLPPALLEPQEPGGPPLEPICADARKHADGKRLAFLKLAAGMLDMKLDELVRRDAARRQRRLAMATGASMAGTVAMAGLALYANDQRILAVEQREIAEANERRAEATTDFLVDIFAVANPATENPRTITALTILERGADRIDEELSSEPEIQSRLYSTLGIIHLNLGLSDEAQELLERNEKLLKRNSPEELENRLSLALTASAKGDLPKALALVESSAKDAARHAPDNVALRAMVEDRRGMVQRYRFELDDALAAYRRANDLYKMEGMKQQELNTLSMIGAIESLIGRRDDAHDTLEEVLEKSIALNGPNSEATGYAYNALAFNALESGNAEKAIEYGESTIRIWNPLFGQDHPTTATARILQGRAYSALKNRERAVGEFEEAAAILRRAYPAGHYEVGFAEVYLANELSFQGRTDEALKLLESARRQYDISYGGLHLSHADLEAYRGMILHRAGRVAEARAACADAASMLEGMTGADSPAGQEIMRLCEERGLMPG